MPANVDNGWAWVVCFAAMTAYCLSYGIQWSVLGIFNVVFLEEFDYSSQAVAWIFAVSNAALYISACLSGIVINAIGCRAVLFLSGIITGLGLIASSFAQHIYHLYFSFGIFGAGNGLVMLSAMLPVLRRFRRKRTIAVGLTSSGCGVGLFLIPVLLEYILHYYHWRQATLIFGALMLNLCVCATACFPIHASSKELLPKTKLLRLSMFKVENYIKLSINNMLLTCGLTIEMLVLPAYATIQLKYTSYQSAMLLSLVGISNLIGRLLYGFLANQPKLTSLRLYSISLILLGLFSFCVTFSKTYCYIGSFAVLLGFLSASYGTLTPLLLLEFVKDKHLNNAYGFLCLYMAIGALVGPPLSGKYT